MMTHAIRILFELTLAVAALTMTADMALAQAGSEPNNDLPNPYQSIDGWAKMPVGRHWGATSSIDVDPDGKSIWIAERCGLRGGGELIYRRPSPKSLPMATTLPSRK